MKLKIHLSILVCLLSSVCFAKSLEERLKGLEEHWAQQESIKIEQNAKLAETIAQLDRMRADLQVLGGSSESQTVQAKQLQDSLERHYRDLEMRLNAVESKLQLFEDQLRRAIAKVAPQLAAETKQFEKGLDQVQKGEYAQAIGGFQQFLQQYPKSPQRSEALFWIAECRYAMKDYSQAIKDYQKFMEQFPKSSKAPLAVLKQGDGFLNLQMKEEAKVFYKKLIQDYPKSEEAMQAQGKLASLDKTGTAPTRSPTTPSPTPLQPPSPVPSPETQRESDF